MNEDVFLVINRCTEREGQPLSDWSLKTVCLHLFSVWSHCSSVSVSPSLHLSGVRMSH